MTEQRGHNDERASWMCAKLGPASGSELRRKSTLRSFLPFSRHQLKALSVSSLSTVKAVSIQRGAFYLIREDLLLVENRQRGIQLDTTE